MYNKITQLEIELTSKCNASCPQCVRNYYGGSVWKNLPLVDIDLSALTTNIKSIVGDLEHIRLCGTYGDPCVYKHLIEFIDWVHANSNCKISISTNGSMHRTSWWTQLANHLREGDKVFFGIDGLSDTHHLHRKGTDFNKIISNLTAFNNAGGTSIWNFIVFKHNQHQVESARELSKQIGCHQFTWKSTSRFVDKTHTLVDRSPVMNRKDKVIYWLYPTNDQRYVNHGYDTFAKVISDHGSIAEYAKVADINCISKASGLVYIAAEGYVLPCGFLHDRFYGAESETHPDRQKLFDMIENLDQIDITNRDIQDIVSGEFFTRLEHSWRTPEMLERCANQCGTRNTLFEGANRDLSKSWTGKTSFPIANND